MALHAFLLHFVLALIGVAGEAQRTGEWKRGGDGVNVASRTAAAAVGIRPVRVSLDGLVTRQAIRVGLVVVLMAAGALAGRSERGLPLMARRALLSFVAEMLKGQSAILRCGKDAHAHERGHKAGLADILEGVAFGALETLRGSVMAGETLRLGGKFNRSGAGCRRMAVHALDVAVGGVAHRVRMTRNAGDLGVRLMLEVLRRTEYSAARAESHRAECQISSLLGLLDNLERVCAGI